MPIRTFLLISILAISPAIAGVHPPAGDLATRAAVTVKHDLAGALGRWDITVQAPGGAYPSWLEIERSQDGSLKAWFVGRIGGARPVRDLRIERGRIRIALPPQFESRGALLQFDGALHSGWMKGETTTDAGERVTWSAVRAPSLARRKPPRWGQPYPLIAPDGLAGWRARGTGDDMCWSVREGTLSTNGPCPDLVTERKFKDFKLDLEFMVQPGSDSGVHLRGRYEIQLKDDVGGMPEDLKGLTGGVYGWLQPLRLPARKPREWQKLRATLVGRTLTVVLNGETVIDAQEIPGITGDALDSDEGAPGPIMLQGYLGPVSYRNIMITPALP